MGKIIVGGENPYVLDVSTGERAAVGSVPAEEPVPAPAREESVVAEEQEAVATEAAAPAEAAVAPRKKGVPSRKAGKGRR